MSQLGAAQACHDSALRCVQQEVPDSSAGEIQVDPVVKRGKALRAVSALLEVDQSQMFECTLDDLGKTSRNDDDTVQRVPSDFGGEEWDVVPWPGSGQNISSPTSTKEAPAMDSGFNSPSALVPAEDDVRSAPASEQGSDWDDEFGFDEDEIPVDSVSDQQRARRLRIASGQESEDKVVGVQNGSALDRQWVEDCAAAAKGYGYDGCVSGRAVRLIFPGVQAGHKYRLICKVHQMQLNECETDGHSGIVKCLTELEKPREDTRVEVRFTAMLPGVPTPPSVNTGAPLEEEPGSTTNSEASASSSSSHASTADPEPVGDSSPVVPDQSSEESGTQGDHEEVLPSGFTKQPLAAADAGFLGKPGQDGSGTTSFGGSQASGVEPDEQGEDGVETTEAPRSESSVGQQTTPNPDPVSSSAAPTFYDDPYPLVHMPQLVQTVAGWAIEWNATAGTTLKCRPTVIPVLPKGARPGALAQIELPEKPCEDRPLECFVTYQHVVLNFSNGHNSSVFSEGPCDFTKNCSAGLASLKQQFSAGELCQGDDCPSCPGPCIGEQKVSFQDACEALDGTACFPKDSSDKVGSFCVPLDDCLEDSNRKGLEIGSRFTCPSVSKGNKTLIDQADDLMGSLEMRGGGADTMLMGLGATVMLFACVGVAAKKARAATRSYRNVTIGGDWTPDQELMHAPATGDRLENQYDLDWTQLRDGPE